MNIHRNSNSYKLLKYLAIGSGILLLPIFAPMLIPTASPKSAIAIFEGYFRKKRFEKERLLRDLKNLQKRELLDYQELKDGKIKIILTKIGKEKTLLYQIDEMKLNKLSKWNGKWRLIMFDVPENKKKARDALRMKLKEMDFYPIQKSVFITPYPCEDEIDFIASFFNIRKHIVFLEIGRFEGEEKLKHYFKI